MDKEREWLLKEKYGGEKSPGFFADCARLEAGEPLAYIIGNIPFLDTTISLASKPLIPRPETEYWVGKAIGVLTESLKNRAVAEAESPRRERKRLPDFLHILDLCAGSGAIGVAVGKTFPLAHVDFAEIDVRHHGTIVDNICDNGLDYTLSRVFGGDLFGDIPRGTKYDVILSNPPYIDPALDRAEPSVKTHEPHLALYGGTAGMEIIARIINESPDYLTPTGTLWIEHEPEQVGTIRTLALANKFSSCVVMNDQYGVARVSILTRPPSVSA